MIGFGKVLFPVIFIAVYTVVAISSLVENKENLPTAIGLFLGGLPLYYILKKAMDNLKIKVHKAQRHKTKAQRHKGTKAQRHKNDIKSKVSIKSIFMMM
jgi:hypothetical protein